MSDPRLDALAASMPFAGQVGLRFTQADKACVQAQVTVGAEHCTAGGIAHGGFLMTLADCAGGRCVPEFAGGQQGDDHDRKQDKPDRGGAGWQCTDSDRRAGQHGSAPAGLADADRDGGRQAGRADDADAAESLSARACGRTGRAVRVRKESWPASRRSGNWPPSGNRSAISDPSEPRAADARSVREEECSADGRLTSAAPGPGLRAILGLTSAPPGLGCLPATDPA